MIIFELTMPGRGSWNGRWSGEGRRFLYCKPEAQVPKELVGKDYLYRWDDGWEACVSVTKVPYREAHKLMKKSAGFLGYDWMIRSILKKGRIEKPERE